MEEIGLKFIYWLIVFTGSIVLTWGLLHISWFALGKIIKLLGYWPMFMKALAKVAEEKYKKG